MDAYIYRAALYCAECTEEAWTVTLNPTGTASGAFSSGSDTMPRGPYANGGGEADSPQHCDSCRVFLENPLTEDGIEYVREELAAMPLPVRAMSEWASFYGFAS